MLIEAARGRDEPLDHILLSGPPGPRQDDARGRHRQRARRAPADDVRARPSSAPGDLAAILTNLEERDVLFIDEIHRLNRAVEEVLYPAMEDFSLDIVIGKGPAARSLRLDLPRFTLDRRDHAHRAAHRAAARPLRHGVPARLLHARRARGDRAALGGHPRRDDRRRGRGRDRAALARHASAREPPAQARARLRAGAPRRATSPRTSPPRRSRSSRSTTSGSTGWTSRSSRRSRSKFSGRPVGLNTLAAAVGEEPDTLEDVYEPYLLQLGFLDAHAEGPSGHAARVRAPRHEAAPAPGAGAAGRALLGRATRDRAAAPRSARSPAAPVGAGRREPRRSSPSSWRCSSPGRRRCSRCALVAVPGVLLGWGAGVDELVDAPCGTARLPWVVLAAFAVLLAVGRARRGRAARERRGLGAQPVQGPAAGRRAQPRFESRRRRHGDRRRARRSRPSCSCSTSAGDQRVRARHRAVASRHRRDARVPRRGSRMTSSARSSPRWSARIVAGDILFGTALAALMGPLKAVRELARAAARRLRDRAAAATAARAGRLRGRSRLRRRLRRMRSTISAADDAAGCLGAIGVAVFLAVVVAVTYAAVVAAAWIVTLWGRAAAPHGVREGRCRGDAAAEGPGSRCSPRSRSVVDVGQRRRRRRPFVRRHLLRADERAPRDRARREAAVRATARGARGRRR